MRVLISGASIAGPVLAYWLARYGFTVTVVERAPRLRKTGGHAVDLFRPAMEISERMGVIPQIEKVVTGTNRVRMQRQGAKRPVVADLSKVFEVASDRHVEIMRDDLSEIYHSASKDDAEYVFGDSITSISADGEVTFEHGPARSFDVVVGADGLHSNVRRLVFGEERTFSTFLGAYLSVLTVPKELAIEGEMMVHQSPGRMAGLYTADHMDDARALFLFRSEHELDYHYRDVPRQKELLRQAFAGADSQVRRWLAELDDTPAFIFDSITQLRMNSWSRGRVTLAGDAGYCPGPAVGGSTTLAVIGSYVLAGHMAMARDDYERAFAGYEQEMSDLVKWSRGLALQAAKRLIPRTNFGIAALGYGARLVSALPVGLSKRLAGMGASRVRVLDGVPVRDYVDLRSS